MARMTSPRRSDIVPTALHERTPLVIGGAADVEYVNLVIAEAEGLL
jgi:fructose-1,6-bisphosphatase